MSSSPYFAVKALATLAPALFAWLLQTRWPQHALPDLRQKRWTNFSLGLVNGLALLTLGPLFQILPTHVPSVAEIMLSLLLFDFMAYAFHWLFHRVDLLFRVHGVHHSDPALEFSSAWRFHALEVLPTVAFRWIVAWSLGISFLSVAIFEALFQLQNLLQHSNVKLPEAFSRRMRLLFVTPAMHRLHHSMQSQEMNSNYSTLFSFWDRIFRTLRENPESRIIQMGLSPGRTSELKLWGALTHPFRRASDSASSSDT